VGSDPYLAGPGVLGVVVGYITVGLSLVIAIVFGVRNVWLLLRYRLLLRCPSCAVIHRRVGILVSRRRRRCISGIRISISVRVSVSIRIRIVRITIAIIVWIGI
jgi:hypothetical protein